MSLTRGRQLDPALGEVGITADHLQPLPDDLLENPESAWLVVGEWFPDAAAPLEIEIGSGKGTFLVQHAPEHRDTNFLGIEYAGEFFTYAADRVRRHGLANVRMLHFDASEFIRWRVASDSVRAIHLYFPDPWPKKKHHRRRMIQDAFLLQAHRVLQPDGELRIVTDHSDYFAWMEEHAARHESLFERDSFERPGSAGADEVVGTNFERKYRREGRPFHAMVLRAV